MSGTEVAHGTVPVRYCRRVWYNVICGSNIAYGGMGRARMVLPAVCAIVETIWATGDLAPYACATPCPVLP
eukprot:3773650-Rhodomonas_salina.1